MNSLDILHTVNVVAVATSNLRFCFTFPELVDSFRIVRGHLESIRFSISDELYAVLISELRRAYSKQLAKIEELE